MQTQSFSVIFSMYEQSSCPFLIYQGNYNLNNGSDATFYWFLLQYFYVVYGKSHTKSLLKQVAQYGFPFCSLKIPWLSCRRQKAHTKCSG